MDQVRSIMAQMKAYDELIVVDDCSTDDTASRLREIQDPRLHLVMQQRNLGHVKTFERALSHATKPIVFLADQDDLWEESRVDWMVNRLSNHGMVATNFTTFGEVNGWPTRLLTAGSQRRRAAALLNILGLFAGRRPYYGCAMALRREMLAVALPFPKSVEAHDQWLALVGNCALEMCHDPRSSVRRRIHGSNLTSGRRRLLPVVYTRVKLVSQLCEALCRTWLTGRGSNSKPHVDDESRG